MKLKDFRDLWPDDRIPDNGRALFQLDKIAARGEPGHGGSRRAAMLEKRTKTTGSPKGAK